MSNKPPSKFIQTTLSFAGRPSRPSTPSNNSTPSPTAPQTFTPFSETRTPLRPSTLFSSPPTTTDASDSMMSLDLVMNSAGEVDDPIEDDTDEDVVLSSGSAKRVRMDMEKGDSDTDVDDATDLDDDGVVFNSTVEIESVGNENVRRRKGSRDGLVSEARMMEEWLSQNGGGASTSWREERENELERMRFENWMLFEFAGTFNTTSLSPYDAWDSKHVRLPCSPKNIMQERDGPRFSKWDIIKTALQSPIRTAQDLKEVIFAYNPTFLRKWDLSGLEYYLEHTPNATYLFQTVLPGMSRLALRLPELVQVPVPLLRKGYNKAVTLSQMQIASLLANAFFCTFPRRNDHRRTAEFASYPSINCNSLFSGSTSHGCEPRRKGKLDGLFEYFARILRDEPQGSLTFHRHVMSDSQFPDWSELDTRLCSLEVRSDGMIEDDGIGMLQMDFANKYIGGGVLNHGCVQEEIRFIINPELLISRLFTEVLAPNEAVVMVGAERYGVYRGYGDTFEYAGPHRDNIPRDNLGRIKTEIAAVDALYFSHTRVLEQYSYNAIVRELDKAFVGFVPSPASCLEEGAAVATGNWGCGAFNGDPELKSLIQITAAAAANRPLLYFTFGNEEFAERLKFVYQMLKERDVTAGELFQVITAYYGSVVRRRVDGQPPGMGLFQWVLMRMPD